MRLIHGPPEQPRRDHTQQARPEAPGGREREPARIAQRQPHHPPQDARRATHIDAQRIDHAPVASPRQPRFIAH